MQIHQTKFPAPQLAGGGTVHPFRVLEGAQTYNLLTDDLYKFKAGAGVREVCCNAQDAHTAAGTPNRPIEVQLPTEDAPLFRVQDYGTGMSLLTLTELYTVVGWSDKRQDQSLIGGQGIGAKAPLAYLKMVTPADSTPSFTVTSVHGGTTATAVIYLDGTGVPKMQVLDTGPSREAPGTTVQFAVPVERIKDFNAEATKVLALFTPTPIFSGVDVPAAKPAAPKLVNAKFGILGKKDGERSMLVPSLFSVRQNNVVYPSSIAEHAKHLDALSGDALHFWQSLAGNAGDAVRSHSVILDVPEGSLAFLPSREGLQSTDKNAETISKLLNAEYQALLTATKALVTEHNTFTPKTLKAWREALAELPLGVVHLLLLTALSDQKGTPAWSLARLLNYSGPRAYRTTWGRTFPNVVPGGSQENRVVQATDTCEVKLVSGKPTRKIEQHGFLGKKDGDAVWLPVSPIVDTRFVYVDQPALKSAEVTALLNKAVTAYAQANPKTPEVSWFVYQAHGETPTQSVRCAIETAEEQKARHPLLSETPVQALSELLDQLGVPNTKEARASRSKAVLVRYDVASGKGWSLREEDIDADNSSWLVLKDLLTSQGEIHTRDPLLPKFNRHKHAGETLRDLCKGLSNPPKTIVLSTHKSALPKTLVSRPNFIDEFKGHVSARWAVLNPSERGVAHCLRTESRFGNLTAIRTGSGAFKGLDYGALYRVLQREQNPLLEAVTVLLGAPLAHDDAEFTTWAKHAIAGMAALGHCLTYSGKVADVHVRLSLTNQRALEHHIAEQFPLLSLHLDVAKDLDEHRFDPAMKLHMAHAYLGLLKTFNSAPAGQLATYFELHDN